MRRYKRALDENTGLPDLIIVDGGKGQLSSAAKSLAELGLLGKVPIIGIAKQLEEIFMVNDPIPLHIDKRSTSLKLMQQLRNEAHRFAITFHRDLRSKNTSVTHLTDLEGIHSSDMNTMLVWVSIQWRLFLDPQQRKNFAVDTRPTTRPVAQ